MEHIQQMSNQKGMIIIDGKSIRCKQFISNKNKYTNKIIYHIHNYIITIKFNKKIYCILNSEDLNNVEFKNTIGKFCHHCNTTEVQSIIKYINIKEVSPIYNLIKGKRISTTNTQAILSSEKDFISGNSTILRRTKKAYPLYMAIIAEISNYKKFLWEINSLKKRNLINISRMNKWLLN